MTGISCFSLYDLFFNYRRKNKVVIAFEVQANIVGGLGIVLQYPFTRFAWFFGAGAFYLIQKLAW